MEIKNEINKLAEMTQREFSAIRKEIVGLKTEMKSEVGGLKTEMGSMKSEVGGLKTEMGSEIGGLKTEMGSMKSEVGGLKTEMGSMKSEVGGLKTEMGSMKSEIDERFNLVLNSQDRILKSLENLEMDNTMGAGASQRQENKLENHEERIVVVEEKLEVVQ